MGSHQAVFEQIDRSREEMISFLGDIISIPAVGPLSGGNGEQEKSDLIESIIRSWGIETITHHDALDGKVPSGKRPNMRIDIKGADPSRRIVIIAHMDVVPPGDLSGWSGDPYRMRREGDRLIGRGVEDNGQALTASLFAVKTLKDMGIEPIHDIVIFLVSDEEETNEKGIGHLLKEGLIRKDDMILVPDHGEPEGRVIELCEKTLLWVKVTVRGKQCHASMPNLGNNALRASMLFGTEVDRALHERYDRIDPLFDHPVSSFEPTKKGPGVDGINVLPGEDVFYIDCRLIPPYTVEEALGTMGEVAESVGKLTGTSITIDTELSETTLHPTPPDSDVVKALSKAIKIATGKEHINGGIGGGTCAALLRNNGFEVAVWETIHNRAHSSDEYVLIENLISDCKVFTALFMGA
ncbi:MAG: M20 family metallo-hydrolase [Thermoplasmata archaeon]|nr:M20 family metallo-hydrolase [Thermoplasmata archaeon]